MDFEFKEVNGEKVMVIRQSNPDKPTPNPKPFCQPGQVEGMIGKIRKRLASDPEGPLVEYYTALLDELKDGRIPAVV